MGAADPTIPHLPIGKQRGERPRTHRASGREPKLASTVSATAGQAKKSRFAISEAQRATGGSLPASGAVSHAVDVSWDAAVQAIAASFTLKELSHLQHQDVDISTKLQDVKHGLPATCENREATESSLQSRSLSKTTALPAGLSDTCGLASDTEVIEHRQASRPVAPPRRSTRSAHSLHRGCPRHRQPFTSVSGMWHSQQCGGLSSTLNPQLQVQADKSTLMRLELFTYGKEEIDLELWLLCRGHWGVRAAMPDDELHEKLLHVKMVCREMAANVPGQPHSSGHPDKPKRMCCHCEVPAGEVVTVVLCRGEALPAAPQPLADPSLLSLHRERLAARRAARHEVGSFPFELRVSTSSMLANGPTLLHTPNRGTGAPQAVRCHTARSSIQVGADLSEEQVPNSSVGPEHVLHSFAQSQRRATIRSTSRESALQGPEMPGDVRWREHMGRSPEVVHEKEEADVAHLLEEDIQLWLVGVSVDVQRKITALLAKEAREKIEQIRREALGDPEVRRIKALLRSRARAIRASLQLPARPSSARTPRSFRARP